MFARPTVILIVVLAIIAPASVFGETEKVVEGAFDASAKGFNGAFLDPAITGASSPEEIEQMIIESLGGKRIDWDVKNGYKIHRASHGSNWVFAIAWNGPRGLEMGNVYCYEQQKPDLWMLRAYIPLWMPYYKNSRDLDMSIQEDGNHINVIFREVIIYTTPSKK